VSGATVSSGGTVELVGGAALPPSVKLSAGAILALGSGEVLSGFTVTSGLTVKVLSGGSDINAAISAGGAVMRPGPKTFSRGPMPRCESERALVRFVAERPPPLPVSA
jgi:hypothetical protein